MSYLQQRKRTIEINFAALSIFVGLIFSQATPTFGTQLGFVGNYLPVVFSSILCVFGVLFFIISHSILVNTSQFRFIFSFLVILPLIVIIGHSSTGPSFQTFIDISKLFLMAIFFLVGIVFCRCAPLGGDKYIILLIGASLAINMILFFSFVQNTNSDLINLYRTRIIGGLAAGNARFSGAWNFPYNLTVLLVAHAVVLLALIFNKSRSTKYKLLAAFALVIVVMMISLAQSRSAFVALLISPLLTWILIRVSTRKAYRVVPTNLFRTAFILSLFIFTVIIFRDQIHSAFQTNVARVYDRAALGGIELLVQTQRFGRFDRYFDGIEQAPFGLLFGFSRDSVAFSGDPYESMADYFVRFGLLGGSIFFFVPVVTSIAIAITTFRVAEGYWFLGCVFLVSLSISASLHFTTTIFHHFRFIPLYFFMLGYFSERIRSWRLQSE